MIFEIGQNLKLYPHSSIICQMFFFLNFVFIFCIMFITRYLQFSFADLFFKTTMYIEASIDEECDLYVVLNILEKITTGYIS